MAHLLKNEETAHRADYHWMLASMAIASHALGRAGVAAKYERRFFAESRVEPWMRDTFLAGKERALQVATAEARTRQKSRLSIDRPRLTSE